MGTHKVWRLYENIPQTDWIYMGGILLSFSSRLQEFGIKNYIKEVLSSCEYFNDYFYFHPDEYQKTQKEILGKIKASPEYGFIINRKLEKLDDRYSAFAREAEKISLKKLSNNELTDLWEKLYKSKEKAHAIGMITTWLLDADEQPFTKWITDELEKLIQKRKAKLNPQEIFAVLSIYPKYSYIQQEEIELLKLFKNHRPNINQFAKKYGWFYYGYIGPAKTAIEYEAILKEWQKQNLNPEEKIAEIKKKKEEIIKKQQNLIEILKPSSKLLKLIRFTQEVILMKDHRKTSQFYGAYVNEGILKEVAKRLSLSLTQVRHFLPWEIKPALLNNQYDPIELTERYKFSVYQTIGSKYKILTGQNARDYIKKQVFEKIKIDVHEIRGICASPGETKGRAKIINLPEEIGKIKEGEIMISHATYPALVPAMKKAAAIVTDEGGITSHAAIVSRELDTPCVVGTKIGTKLLRDGDLVEVNANEGLIKKLKEK